MKHYTARMHHDLFGRSQSVVHNVFFGLMPDDTIRGRMVEAVKSLRASHDPQGRWLKPARYHMTLHFLGTFSELPEDRIAAAIRAAEGLRSPAFDPAQFPAALAGSVARVSSLRSNTCGRSCGRHSRANMWRRKVTRSSCRT
jgi:hypothetical protein